MIKMRFEYWCDYCGAEIVGADVHEHGAEYGRYPVPRHVTKVGSGHACTSCAEKAVKALKLTMIDMRQTE